MDTEAQAEPNWLLAQKLKDIKTNKIKEAHKVIFD